ncbi:MAG: hypothetical protein H6591_07030 [Flavobacteriales bacterium]|nr:hypothetical protein [Flavobacteriales bacterium]
MNREPKPLLWLYSVVIAAGLISILDMYLPAIRARSVITRVTEFGSFEGSENGTGRMRYWSSIDLDNGSNIWTQRTANNFAVGDSMDLDLSAVLRHVVRYRGPGTTARSWFDTEGANKDYRPFPFAVVLFALLLFYPNWSIESRMLLRGVLAVTLIAWLITMAATGG